MSLVDAVKRAAKAHDDLPGFAKDALYINQSGGGREMTQFFDNNAAENEKRYQEYLALVKENATLRAENLTLHLDLSKIIAGLENDVARLTEAIEWTIEGIQFELPFFTDQLRARAFPPTEPEYEEVEVKRWFGVFDDGTLSASYPTEEEARQWVVTSEFLELTGTRRIPRRKKVSRREEIDIHHESISCRGKIICRVGRGREMTIEDRTLIENAAKAMGYEPKTVEGKLYVDDSINNLWVFNPLTSNADCAEMCDQLEIDVIWLDHRKQVQALKSNEMEDDWVEALEPYGTDKAAARRRASTRVAAEMGVEDDRDNPGSGMRLLRSSLCCFLSP